MDNETRALYAKHNAVLSEMLILVKNADLSQDIGQRAQECQIMRAPKVLGNRRVSELF